MNQDLTASAARFRKHIAKEWVGGAPTVRIAFNDDGKVRTILEGVPPAAGVFEKVKAWLDSNHPAYDPNEPLRAAFVRDENVVKKSRR